MYKTCQVEIIRSHTAFERKKTVATDAARKQATSALFLETIFMFLALRLTFEWLQSIPVLDPDFENVDWPREVYHIKIIGPNRKHFPVLSPTFKKQMTTNCNTDTKGQGFTFLEPKT